ncbi:hypothetical protein [Spongiactinospora sp. TRM90649]|uniref:hypothetical protein n=1 Tax=Spongiactinospora sp. TRM90649 TaxID=3031114 RepID=UPI0023F6FF7E|nr:hypothetical protein [Spongiactinospora sp. TRM90649]MDF5752375.1 hypothetical protein [Spongiactinospora sp. TRM90649]
MLSLWRGEMCTASFRMPLEDVGRLIDTLDDGYEEAGGDQIVESGQHAAQYQEGEQYAEEHGDYPETGHYARPGGDEYAPEYQPDYHGGDDYQGGHYPEQETQAAPPPEERPAPTRPQNDVLVARGTPAPDKLVAGYGPPGESVPRENLIVGDSLPYVQQQPTGADPGYGHDAGYGGPSETGYHSAPDPGYAGGHDSGYRQAPDTGYQQAPDGGYQQGGAQGYQQSDSGYHSAPDTGYQTAPDTGYQQAPDPNYGGSADSGYHTAPEYPAPGEHDYSSMPQTGRTSRRSAKGGGPATDPYGFSASEVDDQAPPSYQGQGQPSGRQAPVPAPGDPGDYSDRYAAHPDPYPGDTYPPEAYPAPTHQQQGRQVPHPDPYGTPAYPDDDAGYRGGEHGRHYPEDDNQGYRGVDPADPLGLGGPPPPGAPAPESDDYYQTDSQVRPYINESLYATGERLRPEQGHDPRDNHRDW